ncbi:Curved DNA-binding protein [Cyphellophora attinorum]|uniref:Curved DNA-binding protein n=1 Tax=Cyphellophora attinorum TaxID=1664694 RepID=A0A0N0NMY3_9EURO|nr:Curved DNA-binding protein [Phialophora attinorum]KPI40749.1 Curved DNA-binding protein [Phialophora attinorum]
MSAASFPWSYSYDRTIRRVRLGAAAQSVSQQPRQAIMNDNDRFDVSKDYYAILGVTWDGARDATTLKRCYHKLALKYHPDKTGDTNNDEFFKQVLQAYEVLRDVTVRFDYDNARQLAGYPKAGPESPNPHEAFTETNATFPEAQTASAESEEAPGAAEGEQRRSPRQPKAPGKGYGHPKPSKPKRASKAKKAGKFKQTPRKDNKNTKKQAEREWAYDQYVYAEDSASPGSEADAGTHRDRSGPRTYGPRTPTPETSSPQTLSSPIVDRDLPEVDFTPIGNWSEGPIWDPKNFPFETYWHDDYTATDFMAGLDSAVKLLVSRARAAVVAEKDALRRMEGDHSAMYFERVKEYEDAKAEAGNLMNMCTYAHRLYEQHRSRSSGLKGARKSAKSRRANARRQPGCGY